MLRGVLRKFEMHVDIRSVLLATGDPLVENAPNDYYWGCGADGSGQNKLGQILMEVRNLLRLQQVQEKAEPSLENIAKE